MYGNVAFFEIINLDKFIPLSQTTFLLIILRINDAAFMPIAGNAA